MNERPDDTLPAPSEATLHQRDDSRPEPTAATRARLDAVPTIAGLDGLLDRLGEGTIVGGRYRILSLLGIGGMGAVYKAHDRLLDLDVALKVLRSEIAGDQAFLQRFRQELIVARRVTHRHVVRIHDLGEHEGMPFMTMDFIPGRSLRELLVAGGKLTVEHSMRLVRQVAEGLGEAHRQGVVHRDLKPSNVLIDESGDAYVTDFGIARSLNNPGLTRTGEVLGTPDYLSPEQARGEKVDGRCDVYALGLIWFEMLSGARPFAGGSLIEVLAQHMSGHTLTLKERGVAVPPAVDAVIRRCLARDLNARYPSAAALIADIDDLRRPGRRRLLRRVEAVAAAALLATAVVLLWRQVPQVLAGARSGSPAAAAPAAATHSVAILPFATAGTSPDLAWSAAGLPELLAAALQESPSIRVVPTARVEQTLRDLGFEAASLDGHGLRRLASLLQVDRIVSGSMTTVGGKLRLSVELDEVSADTVVPHRLAPQLGAASELPALTARLGEELRRSLELPAEAPPRHAVSNSATAMRAYSEGKVLLGRGEYAPAIAALERATTADPAFTPAWVQLSRAYQSQGQMVQALRAAEKASAVAGQESGRAGFEARAQAALLRNRPAEAQQALASLVERYPNDLAARSDLAEAYGGQGNYRAAMATLREVVERDPKDARAWYLLGRFAILAGEVRGTATNYLMQALGLYTDLGNRQGQADVLNALGAAYDRLGRVDQAIRQYREASQLRRELDDQRGLAATQHNLALVLMKSGDFAGAEEAIAAALAIHEQLDNPQGIAELQNAYGLLEEERGSPEAALGRFQQALKLRNELGDDDARAESHQNVGYAYLLLGQYDNAGVYLDTALQLYQRLGNRVGALSALQDRGACEIAQGQWEGAVKTFHTSLDQSRDLDQKDSTAVARISLGRLAALEGRHGAALQSLAEAEKIARQLDWVRAQAEIALVAADALIELGAPGDAARRLAEAAALRGKGLGREHEAQLALLEARLLDSRGQRQAAHAAFVAALAPATSSESAPLVLEAKLGAAETSQDRRGLASALSAARGLGHAALELRAAEALARAELAAGRQEPAIEVLQKALQRARGVGSWGRSWALHQLLARAFEGARQPQRAAEELELARREAARIEAAAPAELRARFAALPAVRELGPHRG